MAKNSLNSIDSVLLIDPEKELYRRFTPLEATKIQLFSDKFKFAWIDTTAYKQIVNAIPLVLFWHITDAIIKYLYKRVLTEQGGTWLIIKIQINI